MNKKNEIKLTDGLNENGVRIFNIFAKELKEAIAIDIEDIDSFLKIHKHFIKVNQNLKSLTKKELDKHIDNILLSKDLLMIVTSRNKEEDKVKLSFIKLYEVYLNDAEERLENIEKHISNVEKIAEVTKIKFNKNPHLNQDLIDYIEDFIEKDDELSLSKRKNIVSLFKSLKVVAKELNINEDLSEKISKMQEILNNTSKKEELVKSKKMKK